MTIIPLLLLLSIMIIVICFNGILWYSVFKKRSENEPNKEEFYTVGYREGYYDAENDFTRGIPR